MHTFCFTSYGTPLLHPNASIVWRLIVPPPFKGPTTFKFTNLLPHSSSFIRRRRWLTASQISTMVTRPMVEPPSGHSNPQRNWREHCLTVASIVLEWQYKSRRAFQKRNRIWVHRTRTISFYWKGIISIQTWSFNYNKMKRRRKTHELQINYRAKLFDGVYN